MLHQATSCSSAGRSKCCVLSIYCVLLLCLCSLCLLCSRTQYQSSSWKSHGNFLQICAAYERLKNALFGKLLHDGLPWSAIGPFLLSTRAQKSLVRHATNNTKQRVHVACRMHFPSHDDISIHSPSTTTRRTDSQHAAKARLLGSRLCRYRLVSVVSLNNANCDF